MRSKKTARVHAVKKKKTAAKKVKKKKLSSREAITCKKILPVPASSEVLAVRPQNFYMDDTKTLTPKEENLELDISFEFKKEVHDKDFGLGIKDIKTEEEVVNLRPVLGGHRSSQHKLDLYSALPVESLQSRQEDEIRSFFSEEKITRQTGRVTRFLASLRGVFSDERHFRVIAPSRTRLFKELKDELLVINLLQMCFNASRAIFAGYFGVLIFFAERCRRLFKQKEETGVKSRNEERVRVTRLNELKASSLAALQPEPVVWRRNFGFLRLVLPVRFERMLATFILLAFVFVLPLRIVSTYREVQRTKSVILERSARAFEALSDSWSQVGNLDSAAIAFEDASKSFDDILVKVKETHRLLQRIAGFFPEGNELDAGKALLAAGSQVAAAAEVLAARLASLGDSYITPAERVHQLGESLDTALPLLNNARVMLDSISLEVIPEKFRSAASAAIGLLDNVISGVESAKAATLVLEDILGRTEPRRFLVVFQNNTELRPTGGFMGSFAEIDTDRGNVTRLWMPGAGSYELQGTLRAVLVPPEPLQLITDHWQFQDANWFPDFPTSAKKIMWFYEKSGGPTVDGVIALTTSVVEKLLKATGPIEMPEYNKVITADNFWLETQKAVELEYDKEKNKPKQFLSDLAPKLLEKLQSRDPKMFFALAQALHESINEKHFQIYMRDQPLEEKITHLGWAGKLKNTTGDMLAVINTNVAGGKTDAVVGEHIKHVARIDSDGKVTVTVEVTRTHHGVKGELFRGVRNVDYVRIYVPQGSTLVSAEGFKKPASSLFKSAVESALPDSDLSAVDAASIYDLDSGTLISKEGEHTVFGNWIMVDPGGSATYKVVYQLPFRIAFKEPVKDFFERLGIRETKVPQAAYSFLFVKQAGTVDTTFEHVVELPTNWKEIWKYPEFISAPAKLDRDQFFGVVMTPG